MIPTQEILTIHLPKRIDTKSIAAVTGMIHDVSKGQATVRRDLDTLVITVIPPKAD